MNGRIRVLYIDDEPSFRELAIDVLERERDRFEVTTAPSGTDGLDRVIDAEFDCVVSDHDLPERDGTAILEGVRDIDPTCPFILLLGDSSDAVATEAVAAGVTDHLEKERSTEQFRLLADRIVAAVEHRQATVTGREMFETVPDGIVVHDVTDGEIVDMNEQYADLFGYDRAQLLDRGFETVLPEESPYTVEQARRRIQEAVDQGPQTFEWPGITADGDRLWTEVHLTPARLHSTDRVLAVVRDITERKAREREIQRKNERLEEFARVVSHDLQSPLQVIELRLDLAQKECDSHHLDHAADAVDRGSELVEDLLTLARQGDSVDETEPVALESLVATCWRNVPTGEATLTMKPECTIQADRSRLRQLLENLFQNAVEHGGESVTVEVGALDDGFYVADDGPGIPADERDEVFESGYSTTRGGTGFGLSIVRSIVEGHGWEIEAAEGDDGGARFEITGVSIED